MNNVINIEPQLFDGSYYDTLDNIGYSSIPRMQKKFYYDELDEAKKLEHTYSQVSLKIMTVINHAILSKDNYSDIINMSKNVFIRQCLKDNVSNLLDYTVGRLANMRTLRCFILLNESIFNYSYPALSIIQSYSDMKDNYNLAKYSIGLISSVADKYLGINNDMTYAGYNTLRHVYYICIKDYDNNDDEEKHRLFDAYLRAFAIKAEVNYKSTNISDYVPISIIESPAIVFLENLENVSHLILHYLDKINID